MRRRLSKAQLSPLRIFIIMIAAIFVAEVVAMIAVYFIEPLPYHLTTLIDAGIMTILIFPVLYYFSFRPLIREMKKSWQAEESLLTSAGSTGTRDTTSECEPSMQLEILRGQPRSR